MSVIFFASCNPFLQMYAHNFLVCSGRGSGDPPTTLANKSSGCTGFIKAAFGLLRFGVFSHAAVNSPPENCNNILQIFRGSPRRPPGCKTSQVGMVAACSSNESQTQNRMNEELLKICRARGLTEEDLDEFVHDAAASEALPRVNEEARQSKQENLLSDASQKASRMNNKGVEAQVEYLVEQRGFDGARQLLEQAEHGA
jgi:hypothetical protein